MTALAFRSASTAFDETGVPTSIDCSLPGGTVVGDLMIGAFLSMTNGEAQENVLPEEWDSLHDETLTILGYGARLRLAYKIAEVDEPGFYTFSVDNPAIELSAGIVCYSGAYLADPIKPRIEVSAGTGADILVGNINTDAPDSTLVAAVITDNYSGGATTVSTDFTKRAEPSGHFALFDRHQATSGASGAFSMLANGGNGVYRVLTASVRTQLPTPVPLGVRLRLYSGSTPRANMSAITMLWWDTAIPANFSAPIAVSSSETTDSEGLLEVDLSSSTELNADNEGFILLFKRQAVATSDLVFAGRLPVQEIL